ncbi:glycosyltransferase [Bosea caraganae]|nr:glycosyltransferase [Bosea caraganae]
MRNSLKKTLRPAVLYIEARIPAAYRVRLAINRLISGHGNPLPYNANLLLTRQDDASFNFETIEGRYGHICKELTVALTKTEPQFPSALAAHTPPHFSLLMPVYKTPIALLEAAIHSVQSQTFLHWELCIVDDGSMSEALDAALDRYRQQDSRIKYRKLDTNAGIAHATNCALKMATAPFIGLIDHDDVLMPECLATINDAISSEASVDVVYSDEFKISESGKVVELFPKPDFSPTLMINCMYTGHFSVYRKELVERVGAFRSKYDFSQDYDLALRVFEHTTSVRHVARYLYGWRAIAGSAAADGKPYARSSNIAALQDALRRRNIPGQAAPLPAANRIEIRDADRASLPLVSIIIPSDNYTNIKHSIDSIRDKTQYKNYEIVIVTNSKLISRLREEPHGNIIFVPFDEKFSFSRKCNVGALASNGTYLCFYNDDVRTIRSDWLDELVDIFVHKDVGIVSPKLIYENGKIQYAGMVTGVRRLVGTAFHMFPPDTSAHFNFAQSVREVSIACGACMVVRSSLYAEIGGFDEQRFPIAHSDIDISFKVRQAGKSCIYTPYSVLRHIGHLSIGASKKEAKEKVIEKHDLELLKVWPLETARDPYFPEAMRSILFVDSQEEFTIHPPQKRAYKADGKSAVIFSHDLTSSGAPRVVLEIARLLTRQNWFVVVTTPSDGPLRQELTELGVTVITDALVMRRHDTIKDLYQQFDIAIGNTILSAPPLAQLAGLIPTMLYSHESELILDLAASKSQLITDAKSLPFVVTGSVRGSNALKALSIPSRILEYGVERSQPTSLREQTRPASKNLRLSLFGSFEPRKGQDLAIFGMSYLPAAAAASCHLSVVGRVLDPEYARIVKSSAPDTVSFIGEVPFREYAALLADSDAVIVPSRDDTLPYVSLDALASGKILIVSATTGTSAYLEHGVSGFVLSHNSPEEIALVIQRVHNMSPSQRRDMSKAAIAVFEKFFTMTAFEERVERHVEEAVQSFLAGRNPRA